MSREGRLRRGRKWWNMRNRDGNLPEGIAKDPSKMGDVNEYLESIKKEEPVSKKKSKGD